MNEPEDPSPLFDDPAMPEGLRGAFRNARADVGTDAQLARLSARLGPMLGGAAVPSAAGSGAASGVGLSGAAKVGLASLALIVAGSGAWLLSASPAEPPPAPTRSTPSAPPLAAAPLPSVAEASVPTAPEPSVQPTEQPSAARALPDKPVVAQPLSEAELLEQARAALRADPARALARANEHARRFPRGVLVQEREVIAIKALRQLGRAADADKRADAFAKAFPGSAFQRKLTPSP
jgi:hypothetical protein